MLKKIAIILFAMCGTAAAKDGWTSSCSIPKQTVNAIQQTLQYVVTGQAGDNGGLFKPNRMWSAIVDRKGVLCSIISSDPDAWPGSRAIAIAKASTANDFSNNLLALSTANLYAPTQPGGSLYGLNNSNPFNSFFLSQDVDATGQVVGGIITFGGGVALYDSGHHIIGGLGVSGDSSCADHAIAYRMRKRAGFDAIPGGAGLNGTDNIVYLAPGEAANSGFKQPHCFPNDVTP